MKCCVDSCESEADTIDHIIPKWFRDGWSNMGLAHKDIGFKNDYNKRPMCHYHNHLKGGKIMYLDERNKAVVYRCINIILEHVNKTE